MNPYKLKNVFEYLTSNNQLLKKKLKLGTDEIPIPPKRKDVIDIEAINRFNKANPRVDTTSLKPLSVKHSNVRQSNVSEPNEGVIQGAFDTATREAQQSGYPAPSYEKFKSRYLKKNMKADGGRAGYEDGGMLVKPSDDGSRPGYSGKKLKSGKKGVTIDGKQYRKITDPNHPKFEKIAFSTSKGGKDITEYLTVEEVKNRVKGKKKIYTESLDRLAEKNVKISKKLNKDINNWSSNWFKNNQSKYSVRNFDKFSKAFGEAWKKELTANPNKYKGFMSSAKTIKFTSGGLPAIKEAITIDGIQFPQRQDAGLAWEKLFYKNKLKDKNFKTKINSYLDWNLTRKFEGGAGSMTKTAALDYGKLAKGIDDDVVYFMGEVLNNTRLNPGGGQTGINDVFKKSVGKKADAYFKKYQGSWGRWTDNFYSVAKLAGLDQSMATALLQKQINDTQKIMKVFNVKKLPLEFMVAQDHLFGLAEAKALGDPKIASQTLKNLVASTKEQNRYLGQEGFSNKRVKLIKNFKAAPKNARGPIINELNALADEFVPGRLQYNVRKDGSLKITNLQPETTLKAKKSAYKNITKTFPKKVQLNMSLELLKKSNPEAAKKVTIALNSGLPIDDIAREIARIPGVRQFRKAFTAIGGPIGVAIEAAFALSTYNNEISKGTPPNTAREIAQRDASFGLAGEVDQARMTDLTNAGSEIGVNTTGFQELKTILDLEKKITAEKRSLEDNKFLNEETGDTLGGTFNIEQQEKNIADLESQYKIQATKLRSSENFDTLFEDYNSAVEYLARKQYNKVVDIKKNQVYPNQGTMGSDFTTTIMDPIKSFLPQNLMETGLSVPTSLIPGINKDIDISSVTRPYVRAAQKIPFIGSIFEPTSDAAKLSAMSEEEKNQRALDMNIVKQNYHPVMGTTMRPDQMEEYYANYFSKGGIASLTKTIPPESGPTPHGLRYPYNNVKKI